MENKKLPAFAHSDQGLFDKIGRGISEIEYLRITSGLTKREYFAGLVLQGLLSGDKDGKFIVNGNTQASGICRQALLVTDELLKQLSNEP